MRFLYSIAASLFASVALGQYPGTGPLDYSGLGSAVALLDAAGGPPQPQASVPNHGLALVAFYDPYCVPCQRVVQHLRYLRQQYWDLDIFYGAINLDREGGSSNNANTVPLPQFVAMRDGKTFEQMYADVSVLIRELDRIVAQYASEVNGGGSGGGSNSGGGGGGYPDDGGDVDPITLF